MKGSDKEAFHNIELKEIELYLSISGAAVKKKFKAFCKKYSIDNIFPVA